MPTYKEALKKLRSTRPKAKPLRRARLHAKLAAGKKKAVRKKPTKKVAKRRVVKKKKIIRKAKPRKKIIRRKPIKKKSAKKVIKRVKPRKKVAKPRRMKKAKPRKKIVKKRAIRKKKIVRKKKIAKRKKPVRKKKPAKRVIKKKRPVKKRKRIARKRKKKVIKPRVYIGKGTLDQLFESQAKVKLLRFFFRNAGSMFQPKEIFKRLRSNTALLRQEMKKMEKIGLLKQKRAWLSFEKKRGGIRKEKRLVYYLNPGFDFFSELRDLILKTAVASKSDLVDRARKTGNIKLLALTGVFTGDDTARADLLIVGDKINHRKLNNFIKDLEAEVGKELNCAVLATKEFDYRYDMYDRFVRDLLDGESEILIKRIKLW